MDMGSEHRSSSKKAQAGGKLPENANMIQKQRKRKRLLLVGSRIRKLRKERNQTQSALASKIGIQQSDLCRMETGEYKVSLETLFKVLSVFEMNIAEFFQEQIPLRPTSKEAEVLDLFRQLDIEDMEEVADFLRFKVHKRELVDDDDEMQPSA
jgi:transcriptional regulator with XRE-family HTH domain